MTVYDQIRDYLLRSPGNRANILPRERGLWVLSSPNSITSGFSEALKSLVSDHASARLQEGNMWLWLRAGKMRLSYYTFRGHMITITLLWAVGKVYRLPPMLTIESLLPGWTGLLLGITCLIQFAVSMTIDAKYDKQFGKIYFWIIWYPVAFWLINIFTIAVGLPRAILKPKGKRALWKSPDRGIGRKK